MYENKYLKGELKPEREIGQAQDRLLSDATRNTQPETTSIIKNQRKSVSKKLQPATHLQRNHIKFKCFCVEN